MKDNIEEGNTDNILTRQVLEQMINLPSLWDETIKDKKYSVHALISYASEYGLLKELLTPAILNKMVVDNVQILRHIFYHVFYSAGAQALLNQLFGIEAFQSIITQHLVDERIMLNLRVIIDRYPAISNKLPRILGSENVSFLNEMFSALANSNQDPSIVFNYYNFNNKTYKEAFELMLLKNKISKDARRELLEGALMIQDGTPFSYIDAPPLACSTKDFNLATQKVIPNIYTKLRVEDHQILAKNVNYIFNLVYKYDPFIINIIENELSKYPVYIGTGEHNIPHDRSTSDPDVDTNGLATGYCIIIRNGHCLLEPETSNKFIAVSKTWWHELTHIYFRRFFANDAKPYPKQANDVVEEKFIKLYQELVQYSLVNIELSKNYYNSEQYETEFIAHFIADYFQFCARHNMAIILQDFIPFHFDDLLRCSPNTSLKEQQRVKELLHELVNYLEYIAFGHADLRSTVFKEAVELMGFRSMISKPGMELLLERAKQQGVQFNYIDAPSLSCYIQGFNPITQKILGNIHTKFHTECHQAIANNIDCGLSLLKELLGEDPLITYIIEYGLSKCQIYIGTGECNILGADKAITNWSVNYNIIIRDGSALINDPWLNLSTIDNQNVVADGSSIMVFDLLVYEATRVLFTQCFANEGKPYYSNWAQVGDAKAQKFVSLYQELVKHPLICAMLSEFGYPTVTHEAWFIANFIEHYIYYHLCHHEAISRQDFIGCYLKYVVLDGDTSHTDSEDQREITELLNKFVDHLTDVEGFINQSFAEEVGVTGDIIGLSDLL
ncbi:hypothetical protein Trichorick_01137 [Candidatus Trichorickettsia mobilis]|uniref:Uncharacterized protein n=1 Tax=Candidatus Trichorickettsia mobilis TaxID=1346319 RepID=A0ABZ0UUF3_9RICK|nr:hypothetical protein [Candidatus Trichorickettsia mobilis]WPY01231.1 hypothetical protein Trichorick_01137 [Candidatus Trichorickettsia mobilis]